MSEQEPRRYATGAIPSARGVLDILATHAERYRTGEINAQTFDRLAHRVLIQAERKACWCDEDVCCSVHNKHVSPHQRCILR